MKKVLSLILAFILVFGSYLTVPLKIENFGMFTIVSQAATANPFTYQLNSDKTGYIITKCDETVEGELVIPEEYNKLPVTEIGYNAFDNCSGLNILEIPNSVTKIDVDSFPNLSMDITIRCKRDSYAYIFAREYFFDYVLIGPVELLDCLIMELNDTGDGYIIKDVQDFTFKELTIPETYKGLPVVAIGDSAFQNCSTLEKVVFSKNITECGNAAFFTSRKLKTIVFNDRLEVIGQHAFAICPLITEINIPASVKEIGFNAFNECNSLKSINVDSENEYYRSIDGVLFAEDRWSGYDFKLVTYPTGKTSESYTVPDNVDMIGEYAFESVQNLKSINISKNVEVIDDTAFFCSSNLQAINVVTDNLCYSSIDGVLFNKDKTEIIIYPSGKADTSYEIPGTVQKIRKHVFSDCENINNLLISDNVNCIEDYAFGATNSFVGISVSDSNESFSAVDGVLFNKDKSKLILYPDKKTDTYYEVPESVTEIGVYAFSCSCNLDVVSIPNTVNDISRSAFDNSGIIIECERDSYAYNYAKTDEIEYKIKSVDCVDVLIFELNETNKEYMVTGIEDGCTYTDIEIPDTYKGLPVVGLANTLFLDYDILKTITIPGSISYIGERVFTFSNELEEINVAESNKMYSSVAGVLLNKSGTEIICYPVGNKRTSYVLPGTVQKIKSDDFISCQNLTSITIPSSVKSIEEYAFRYCTNLSKIVVDKNNKNYSSANGVLFNKSKTMLIQYPIGKAAEVYTIPDTVTNINAFAFWGAEKLKQISTNGVSEEYICNAVANELTKDLKYNSKLTDLEKAMIIYDRLMIHCEYDYFALFNQGFYTHAHNKFGALIKGLAVCDGYTNAYKYLLEKVGIKSERVTSKQLDHAWNTVYVGDGVYYADVTWGDTGRINGNLTHNYFLCSQNDFNESHKADDYGRIENYTTYDNAPWRGICSDVCLVNGKVYYSSNGVLRCLSDENNVVLNDVNGLTTDGQNLYFVRYEETEWSMEKGISSVVLFSYQPDTKQLKRLYSFEADTSRYSQEEIDYRSGKVVINLINCYEDENEFIEFKCSDVHDKKIISLKLETPAVSIKNTAKGINVTWNAIDGAENYIVYRRVYNASTKKWSGWSKLKTGVTATNYVDTTVKLGTTYSYTVRAVNGDVKSGYTGTKGLTYNVTPIVKVANASNGVKVSWSTAANATGYTVYRSQYDTKTKKWTSWKSRGTAKANVTSWTDKKVTSGVQYKYTVRAVYGSVKSSYKASANLIYLAQPTVKIANNAKGVKVSWSKVTGATGYTVYRSEYKNGAWTKWASRGTAKANKSSWVDTKVTSGVQYKYTVRAINGKYKSTYKGTSGLLYLAQPTTTVKAVTNGINVAWTQCDGATGYTVYRSELVGGKWTKWKNMGTAKAEKSNWTDKSAKKGVTYKYTVRAVNGKTASTYKASGSVKR